MRLSESSFQGIKALIVDALKEFQRPQEQSVVTDIHIMPIRETGEVTVSDDDRDLATTQLPDLAEIPEDIFYEVMEKALRVWPFGNPSHSCWWTMTARPWPS